MTIPPQMQKVLVTGGAGYIGSILCSHLIARGYKVIVLDNFMFNQVSLNHLCHCPELEIVRGDARDARLVEHLVRHVDIVIPLAALVGAPLCDADRWTAEHVNHDAIDMLANCMSAEQRMVIPISNSGYGIGESVVVDGVRKYVPCTEESPLQPVSLYGRTKVMAETRALQRANTISLRLATVFGMSPRMRLDLLVNDFVYRAANDKAIVLFQPHFKRNYIHVRDVAVAFLHALHNFDKMKGQVYNVGLSDANLTKLELCHVIKKHVPDFYFVEAEIGEDKDKRDYVVSNAKIEATGYHPHYSLDDGIEQLIKGYRTFRKTVHGNA